LYSMSCGAINITNYTNTGLDSGTKYYYRIYAYNASISSTYSIEANTTTPVTINPVFLGEAAHFVILSKTGVTDNVPPCIITGDVGASPITGASITGLTTGEVTGTIYTVDAAGPAGRVVNPTMLTAAISGMEIAYTDAAGRTPVPTGTFLNPGATNDIGGLTLVPGLYKFTGSASASTDFTLEGDTNDVWIFMIASTLTISNGVKVTLAGGAQAKNIFWQVGDQADLGTTVDFSGNIIALKAIAINTSATLKGRALAQTAVTLLQNTITIPAQ